MPILVEVRFMEKLDRAKIVTLIKSDFNIKKANTYLIMWFLFIIVLEVYVYFEHGMDSIIMNWPSVPVLVVIGVAVYLLHKGFNSAVVKNVEKAISSDDLVVLETKVVRAKKGSGLAELYFSSKHFGKHGVIVDGTTAEEAVENVTRYYLVLTKEKSKYNLALALPASEWHIDADLSKYKVCEL